MSRCSVWLVSIPMLTTLSLLLSVTPLRPQSLAEYLLRGDSLHNALKPAEALEQFRAAFAVDPTSVEAMWRFAQNQADVARLLDDDQRQRRDSLYWVASLYAEAAVRADSNHAEAQFSYATALGRYSRTLGGSERVRFGREIYHAAARAIQLDPAHDGAHHVLGAWHLEVKRLSGITKFFAKNFLGGGFLERASYDSAAIHLERAVELNPTFIFHRLELAEVYVDLGRDDDAIAQLEAIAELEPERDIQDGFYTKQAAQLLDATRRHRESR